MAEHQGNENPLPSPPPFCSDDHESDVLSPSKRSKLDEAEHDGAGSSPDCEVEIVKKDEFDFLDGMTRLATLESEVEDVKSGLMARQGLDQFIPFRLLNPWGNRVLSVTDLTGGMWCEVSVEYRKLYRHLKNSQEWKKMEDKGSPVVLKTETMKKGSEVHLKKELEVHEIVKVETVTKEDRAAVQLINTYNQLAVIKTGSLEREVSVFGDPFESGVLVRGIIDQLQYYPENDELILTDNKTRRAKSLPPPEQKLGTTFQLMLYKYLLDHMCLGFTKGELLYRHLNLDRDACLTQGALRYIIGSGLSGLFSDNLRNKGVGKGLRSPQSGFTVSSSTQNGESSNLQQGSSSSQPPRCNSTQDKVSKASTSTEQGSHCSQQGITGGLSSSQQGVFLTGLMFGTVVDTILEHIAGLALPPVGPLIVNYEHQESGETLHVDTVEYDEGWMMGELRKRLEFWEGSRPAVGVDMESASWKCGSCQFKDICTWRLKKKLEASPAAKLLSPF